MAAERSLVASYYPELSFKIDRVAKLVALEGDISIRADCAIRRRIPVRVKFLSDYPRSEPQAYDSSSRFIHDRDGHFYTDGRCCLWIDCATEWNGNDADALLHFIDQVVVFFHRQLVFEAGGRRAWPGPARGHGPYEYVEFLREQLQVSPEAFSQLLPAFENYRNFSKYVSCPCGSRKAFKWCHGARVQEIIGRVGGAKLRDRLALARRADDNTGKV